MSVRNLFRAAQGRAGPVMFAVVFGAVVLFAGGCGSNASSGVASVNGNSGKASATSTPKANQEQLALQATKCMREHGVNMADPTVDAKGNVRLQPPTGGDRLSQAELQKARDACQQYFQGLQQGFSNQDQTQSRDALLKYARCMRKNGYDMPDPNFSAQGSGSGEPFGGAINRNDPDFKKANAVCQGNLAQFGGGGGGG
jgi:hypothetical protein